MSKIMEQPIVDLAEKESCYKCANIQKVHYRIASIVD